MTQLQRATLAAISRRARLDAVPERWLLSGAAAASSAWPIIAHRPIPF